MPKPPSIAFSRIRADVLRMVALIPAGKFSTYGSIAGHVQGVARHVASVMSRLTAEESASIPWHRVVGAEGRISPRMDEALAAVQRARLEAEGIAIDARGFIQNDAAHFHSGVGRREPHDGATASASDTTPRRRSTRA
jgi:methylated-DNA-protein-cysteine methyltransferase related protein